MDTTSVLSRSAQYTEDYIEAQYVYNTVRAAKRIAETGNGVLPCNLNCDQVSPECATRLIVAEPQKAKLVFRTKRNVPRVGVLLVGLGGNNGSTVAAGILANRLKLSWRTKTGTKQANWFGSLVLASTTRVGLDIETGLDVHAPLSSLLPFSDPAEWVIGGWDISGLALGDAMRRAQVLDITLQDQLYDRLQDIRPLPGIYVPDFIAANQSSRADNILQGSLYQQLEAVRRHIRDFKTKNNLDKIVVLWTATTERFCDVIPGVHTTAADLLVAIENGEQEVSPSTVYAVAAILEGCSYINGSPQNTLVPGVIELAEQHGVFVGGDDFKSGQTKLKSVLVDFLVSAGIKPRSIVSYNHLGNNDGCNLSSPLQFRSKEISKSTVVDDMVASNNVLYKDSSTRPDHCVVIKYVPFVGDSKRALDEYTSEIFMGGLNTIVVHNTCEDSLLAAPLIVDLVLLTELFERVTVRQQDEPPTCFVKLHCVLSLLSYLCKAPMVPFGTPIINALASQRSCIVNIIRACIGLPPDNHMLLEHKIPFLMGSAKNCLK